MPPGFLLPRVSARIGSASTHKRAHITDGGAAGTPERRRNSTRGKLRWDTCVGIVAESVR